MKKLYKLYVWDNVLTDYTSGVMFAYARTLKEAKELLSKECDYIPERDLNKEPEIHRGKCARVVWGGGEFWPSK